jgi:hypothetical protein
MVQSMAWMHTEYLQVAWTMSSSEADWWKRNTEERHAKINVLYMHIYSVDTR